MQRKKIFTIIIIIMVCSFVILFINFTNEEKNKDDDSNVENQKNEIQYQNEVSVDEIKNETKYTADSSLYQVDTEYDGRKVLNIKADLQYKVAFSGIIKKQKIEMNEVEKIFEENHPLQDGIWIEETNRKQIIEMIRKITKSNYKINEKGYLIIEDRKEQNDNDIILERLINSNKKIILTISSFYYEIDNVTGDIVEYPFEKLDSYQPFDMIVSENNMIIVISSNKEGKLNNKQILEEMLIALQEGIL